MDFWKIDTHMKFSGNTRIKFDTRMQFLKRDTRLKIDTRIEKNDTRTDFSEN